MTVEKMSGNMLLVDEEDFSDDPKAFEIDFDEFVPEPEEYVSSQQRRYCGRKNFTVFLLLMVLVFNLLFLMQCSHSFLRGNRLSILKYPTAVKIYADVDEIPNSSEPPLPDICVEVDSHWIDCEIQIEIPKIKFNLSVYDDTIYDSDLSQCRTEWIEFNFNEPLLPNIVEDLLSTEIIFNEIPQVEEIIAWLNHLNSISINGDYYTSLKQNDLKLRRPFSNFGYYYIRPWEWNAMLHSYDNRTYFTIPLYGRHTLGYYGCCTRRNHYYHHTMNDYTEIGTKSSLYKCKFDEQYTPVIIIVSLRNVFYYKVELTKNFTNELKVLVRKLKIFHSSDFVTADTTLRWSRDWANFLYTRPVNLPNQELKLNFKTWSLNLKAVVFITISLVITGLGCCLLHYACLQMLTFQESKSQHQVYGSRSILKLLTSGVNSFKEWSYTYTFQSLMVIAMEDLNRISFNDIVDVCMVIRFFEYLFSFSKNVKFNCKTQLQTKKPLIFVILTLVISSSNATDTPSALILSGPESTNVTFDRENASFACYANGNDVIFLINETLADLTQNKLKGFIQSSISNTGDVLYRTLFVDLHVSPSTVGNTRIACRARTYDPLSTVTSKPALLLVQGQLNSVTNITSKFINETTICFEWTAPPTLIGTTIGYLLLLDINSQDVERVYFTYENRAIYTFIDLSDLSCVAIKIQIIPMNGLDGKPANSSVVYLPSRPASNNSISIGSSVYPLTVLTVLYVQIELHINASGLCPGEYPERVNITLGKKADTDLPMNQTYLNFDVCLDFNGTEVASVELSPLPGNQEYMLHLSFANALGNFEGVTEVAVETFVNVNNSEPITDSDEITMDPSLTPTRSSGSLKTWFSVVTVSSLVILILLIIIFILIACILQRRHQFKKRSQNTDDSQCDQKSIGIKESVQFDKPDYTDGSEPNKNTLEQNYESGQHLSLQSTILKLLITKEFTEDCQGEEYQHENYQHEHCQDEHDHCQDEAVTFHIDGDEITNV